MSGPEIPNLPPFPPDSDLFNFPERPYERPQIITFSQFIEKTHASMEKQQILYTEILRFLTKFVYLDPDQSILITSEAINGLPIEHLFIYNPPDRNFGLDIKLEMDLNPDTLAQFQCSYTVVHKDIFDQVEEPNQENVRKYSIGSLGDPNIDKLVILSTFHDFDNQKADISLDFVKLSTEQTVLNVTLPESLKNLGFSFQGYRIVGIAFPVANNLRFGEMLTGEVAYVVYPVSSSESA